MGKGESTSPVLLSSSVPALLLLIHPYCGETQIGFCDSASTNRQDEKNKTDKKGEKHSIDTYSPILHTDLKKQSSNLKNP